MPAEAYFSCDVESDGPIPGPYSMSSFGFAVPGYRTRAGELVRLEAESIPTFYAELKPISDKFNPESAAVAGFDREALIRDGQDPAQAMHSAADWIASTCAELGDRIDKVVRPVFAAYPLSFDWSMAAWYFYNFTGSTPFGHSTAIDMKTLFATKAGRGIVGATKRNMTKHLLGKGPHTHNALDDAREQGEMLMNLLKWNPS